MKIEDKKSIYKILKNILKNQIFNKFIFILKNIIQIININIDNTFNNVLILIMVINLKYNNKL